MNSSTEYSVLGTETAVAIAVRHIPGKGRGVVALGHFGAGQTIERPPVIVIPREEVCLIRETHLAHYYYEWGEDDDEGAIALGYGSLYNHSYTPNARFEFHEAEQCLEFIALSDIEPGEEITINYNNLGPDADKPLKFDVK
jgi:SET domain-containing protein